ncbi:MAG: trans-aconitate 2-methyltransferase [Limisphaerales bacterium]
MSFERLAPHYRAMEAVLAGGILQRSRTRFLDAARDRRQALLLGEGPGRFVVELLRSNPSVRVVCVEKSPRMILEARTSLARRGIDASRVQFEERDALTWIPPRDTFDLVVTHYFLDCFRCEELGSLIPRIAEGATRSARWLLADFHRPDCGWRKWRARIILAAMYAFFRIAAGLSASSLTPPDPFLLEAGFFLAERRFANAGLVRSDLWERDPR